ncbi:MAG: phosphoenolpyruvate--protein phosphotransferase [Chthoniobacterales bacterium]
MSPEAGHLKPEKRFSGIPVSPGIAHGNVFVHWFEEDEIPIRNITPEQVSEEVSRFETALIATRAELLDIQERIANAIGAKDASIFDAHLLVIEDRTLIDEVLKALDRDRYNVEYVFHRVAERYCKSLSEIKDAYLRERVVDIEDVARRVIRNLLGKAPKTVNNLERAHILVSHDLSPSDTALMSRELVLGFCTEAGSRTSHTAIMARSMDIPAVVGIHGVCSELNTGDHVLLDGYNGVLILNPSPETLREYGEIESKKEEIEENLELLRDTLSTTRDGKRIILSANIELPDELNDVIASGAEGIGLFRTEFLFLNRSTPPSEEEQYENYRLVAEKVAPHGVIIRTLDIGGDKFINGLDLVEEQNSFLGCRAIRFCLRHPEVFKPQLRAILRAAKHGNIRLMYPMISGVEELLQANAVLEECKKELRAEEKEFREDLEVGIMIEIPSAALCARLLAKHVRFFSIGTNDLIQYSIAVNRLNDEIAHLYDPVHPAVLQLIQMTVEAAHAEKIWVGVCGEMAGDILYTPLLIGLGVDELSAGASVVPHVKKAVQSLDAKVCKELTEEVMLSGDSSKTTARCEEVSRAHYPDLF